MENFWFILLYTCITVAIIKGLPRLTSFIRFRYLLSKLPCMPGAYPILGHTYMIGSSSPDKVFEWVEKVSRYFLETQGHTIGLIWLGSKPFLWLYHPDSVEKVLSSTKHLAKGIEYRSLHPWLNTGLLTAPPKKWTVRRKLLTPSFHFNILDGFLDVMIEEGVKMTDIIGEIVDSGEKVVLEKLFPSCTLDIICRTAMGKGVNAQESKDSEYLNAISV